jgi:hypothetical protein
VSLFRTIIILLAAMTVMLSAVALRAESARLHNQAARVDARLELLRRELREQELELARLRNPGKIRERIAALRAGSEDPAALQPSKPPTARRSKPLPGR